MGHAKVSKGRVFCKEWMVSTVPVRSLGRVLFLGGDERRESALVKVTVAFEVFLFLFSLYRASRKD